LVLLTQRNGRALKLLEAELRTGMLLVQCIEFVGGAEKCSGDVSSLVGCQFC
jgi:hypothetical protein